MFCFPPGLDIEYRLEDPGGNDKTIAALRCVDSCQVWLPPRMVSSLSSHETGDKATEQGVLVSLYLICLSEAQNISHPLAVPDNLELDSAWFSQ